MNILIFVTGEYPFGKGETFIENEIRILSSNFDKILIYSTQVTDSELSHRDLPSNVSLFVGGGKPIKKIEYLKSISKRYVVDEIKKNCLNNISLGRIAACCNFDQRIRQSSSNIDELIESNKDILAENNVVIYSYWLSTIGMTALNIYDKVKKINSRVCVVSRCHGFDLYDERAYLNYQPFKAEMIERFDGIFPCSENGSNYLRKQFPEYSYKINTAYLGVEDHFKGNYPEINDEFHIVSCSNVIPIKRVDKIIEALKVIEAPIRWTHFGDGELFEQLREKAKSLPTNITVEFKGRVPNSEIYEFYNNKNVNLFINVSSSEGLPVSIMEAISFGIPVIATDVGGTSEIVYDCENGMLLNENFLIKELSDKINNFVNMNRTEYDKLCRASRDRYKESFSLRNYSNFCDDLLNVNNDLLE